LAVGIITGSGTYALPGFETLAAQPVHTRWGAVQVVRGALAGVDVLHVSRHGPGHRRLSNHVEHRANIAALVDAGASAAIGLTVCGAVDPDVELGSLVIFDDLHFPSNRLPDGDSCTFFDAPGDPGRGHWIFEAPYCEPLRAALVQAAPGAGAPSREHGTYGHVDGPRFNSRSEIRALAACGVVAVSQTGGPETVLAGEAELPFALVGYATDHANGVKAEPTPVPRLLELIKASTGVFGRLLEHTLPHVDESALAPSGVVYRFDQG
jgi:5'-methylthioadenosine phosphorylase